MKTKISSLRLHTLIAAGAVMLITAACLFTGCVTNPVTGQKTFNPIAWFEEPSTQAQLNTLSAQLTPIAEAALSDYLASGGNLSSAQAVPLAFQSASDIAPSILSGSGGAALSTFFANAASDYAGDPNAKALGATLAKAALATLPANPTAAQVTTATVAVGVALSNAANAPSASSGLDPNNQVHALTARDYRNREIAFRAVEEDLARDRGMLSAVMAPRVEIDPY